MWFTLILLDTSVLCVKVVHKCGLESFVVLVVAGFVRLAKRRAFVLGTRLFAVIEPV